MMGSQKPGTRKSKGEKVVKDVRSSMRKRYSANEKIRMVSDGLKVEDGTSELCRRESITQKSLYHSGSKKSSWLVRRVSWTPALKVARGPLFRGQRTGAVNLAISRDPKRRKLEIN